MNSNRLNMTTDEACAFAPPEQARQNVADGVLMPPQPKQQSRQQRMQEYLHAYANGEVGRERSGWPGEEGDAGSATGRRVNSGGDGADGGDEEMAELVEGGDVDGMMHNPDQDPQQQPDQGPPLISPSEAAAYRAFLAAAQHRKLQRHDLAIRDLIFAESITRTRERLAAVAAEKAALEAKLVQMEKARRAYGEVNVVEVSEVEDEREERRWEEWFRVRRGVEVGAHMGGVGEGQDGSEEEMGGVDI